MYNSNKQDHPTGRSSSSASSKNKIMRLPSPPLLINSGSGANGNKRPQLSTISKTSSPLGMGLTTHFDNEDEVPSANRTTTKKASIGIDNIRNNTDDNDNDNDDTTNDDNDNDDDKYNTDNDDGSSGAVPSDLINKLNSFSLFRNAPPAFHRAIARRLKLIQYHPQEYIVKAGEQAKSMYWILRGSVGVTSTDGEATYAELVAGSFFGEIGILFNRPRTATVVARTRVLLGVLTKDALHQVLPDFPIIERLIRDEAQERLAMQEKKKKAGFIVLPSRRGSTVATTNSSTATTNAANASVGALASQAAEQNSIVPGPMLPPTRSPILATAVSSSSSSSCSSSATDLAILENNKTFVDNVDESISARHFLQNLPLFQTLPSQLIHELTLSVVLRKYEMFDYICRKGESGTDIYFIVAGQVEIIDPSKSNAILARLGPGKYFGEMAFLSALSNGNDGDKRSADIRVIETTVLMIVTGDKLQNVCERYPMICEEMKQTARDRCRHNGSIDANSEQEPQLLHPVSRRLSSYSLIKQDALEQQELDNQIEKGDAEDDVVWKSTSFGGASELSQSTRESRSTSPTSDVFSSSDSLITASTNMSKNHQFHHHSHIHPHHNKTHNHTHHYQHHNTEALETTKQKLSNKRSMYDISPSNTTSTATTTNLAVPPLNPQLPALNSLSFQKPGAFQYMPLAKRLRLNNNNSFTRRRSSVLSTGPLTDKIMLEVFSHIDLKNLMKLRRVCRRWRQLLLVSDQLFQTLDLKPWNTDITDSVLKDIIDFVGSRPSSIDISDCFHITDEGFSYLVNEIGIKGCIRTLKMRSVWKVSAMAIMDLSSTSVGHHLEHIEMVNCRNVRDDVMERLIGDAMPSSSSSSSSSGQQSILQDYYDNQYWQQQAQAQMQMQQMMMVAAGFQQPHQYGCLNLKYLDLSYCKHLTDKTMSMLAEKASDRLETLILTRCTTITDQGFRSWSLKQFPNLKKLVLRDCTYLTDNSMIYLATAAPNLTYLDSSFCCALSDSSIDFLCFCCKNLEYLNLSFCGSAVGDISLVAISRLNALKELIIVGCLRVTREGVDRLLAGSRSLTLIDLSQCKNAHDYPYDGGPGEKWVPRPGTKSAFIKVEPFNRIIEIVL